MADCECGHSEEMHHHILKKFTFCKAKDCDCPKFKHKSLLAPWEQRLSYVANGLSYKGNEERKKQ